MNKTILLATSCAVAALLIVSFSSSTFATDVIRPTLAALHTLIMPSGVGVSGYNEPLSVTSATSTQVGCDQSGTTTNCATIKTSQAAESPTATAMLSTATSYAEVASTSQSGKIDTHLSIDNTLKTVSFCGTVFKTRQIIINGVDVVQRIAYIASNDRTPHGPNDDSIGNGICNSMPHYFPVTKGIIEAYDVTTMQTTDKRAPGDNYVFRFGNMMFVVNPTTNEIFNIDSYDGSTLTSIGKLK